MTVHDLRTALDAINDSRNYEDGLVRLRADEGVPSHLLTHLATEFTNETFAKVGIYPASGYAHRQVVNLLHALVAEITRTDDTALHNLPLAHLMAWLTVIESLTDADLRYLVETVQEWEGVDQPWVCHAAGISRTEYAAAPIPLADAQVLAALRGYPDPLRPTD